MCIRDSHYQWPHQPWWAGRTWHYTPEKEWLARREAYKVRTVHSKWFFERALFTRTEMVALRLIENWRCYWPDKRVTPNNRSRGTVPQFVRNTHPAKRNPPLRLCKQYLSSWLQPLKITTFWIYLSDFTWRAEGVQNLVEQLATFSITVVGWL